MFNAVILFCDRKNPAPTSKEIKDYLQKSSKLIYGNDQRKSKSFSLLPKIDNVLYAFRIFKDFIFEGSNTREFFYELYVFDEMANSSHFALKYAHYSPLFFKLDELIINEMYSILWSYNSLKDARKVVNSALYFQVWAIENNVGSVRFHKSFPTFAKAAERQIKRFDAEMQDQASKAVALFKSGW